MEKTEELPILSLLTSTIVKLEKEIRYLLERLLELE